MDDLQWDYDTNFSLESSGRYLEDAEKVRLQYTGYPCREEQQAFSCSLDPLRNLKYSSNAISSDLCSQLLLSSPALSLMDRLVLFTGTQLYL